MENELVLTPITNEEQNKNIEPKEINIKKDDFIKELPEWDLTPPNTPIRRVERITW